MLCCTRRPGRCTHNTQKACNGKDTRNSLMHKEATEVLILQESKHRGICQEATNCICNDIWLVLLGSLAANLWYVFPGGSPLLALFHIFSLEHFCFLNSSELSMPLYTTCTCVFTLPVASVSALSTKPLHSTAPASHRAGHSPGRPPRSSWFSPCPNRNKKR